VAGGPAGALIRSGPVRSDRRGRPRAGVAAASPDQARTSHAPARSPLPGPPLGPEITTALGEVLHLAITHPAMHLALLVRWRRGWDAGPG
jgi:hypothetical protein